MVLDRRCQTPRFDPGIILDRLGNERARRSIARRQVRHAPALRRRGQKLRHEPAGPPGDARAGHALGDGEADIGGDLFRLAEILVGGRLKPLAVERHDALVARQVIALLDGEGEMAAAEQFRAALGRSELLGIEARKGAQVIGRVEIDDDHVDQPVRAGLQLEAAGGLERGAEQHREHRRLAEEAGHRRRIFVLAQDLIERGAEPDDAAAYIERGHGEGQHPVVLALIGDGARRRKAQP